MVVVIMMGVKVEVRRCGIIRIVNSEHIVGGRRGGGEVDGSNKHRTFTQEAAGHVPIENKSQH